MNKSLHAVGWNRVAKLAVALATCVMLTGAARAAGKDDDKKAAEAAAKAAEAAKEAAAKAAEAAKEAAAKAGSDKKPIENNNPSNGNNGNDKDVGNAGGGNPANGNNGNDKDVGNAPGPKTTSSPSSVQSGVRPFGLEIVNKVQEAASDAKSTTFQKETLPGLSKLVNEKLSEREKIDDSAMLLDPSKLKLKTDADVRVYFVGEGAGYANSLGFTTDGSASVKSDTAALIFPNASSSGGIFEPGQTVRRSEKEPLAAGDFVDLGRIKGGSTLDFFLIANGANGGNQVFTTQTSMNPDGINHVVSFAYLAKDSPYLILGFEDLMGGGDRDFNDLLFAVDVGAINIGVLTAAPEPATVFTMSAFLGLGYMLVRRARAKGHLG